MNFLLDVIIIAIMVGCLVGGYKNGIVKMLFSFFKNIIAIVLASKWCSTLGNYFYEKVLKDTFEGFTLEKIASWLGIEKTSSPDVGPLIDAQHSEFFKFAERLGFDTDAVIEKYNEFGSEAGDLFVETLSKPVGITISNVLAFIVIFVVALIVIKLAGFIIGKIVKLPILNVTNRFLGLVLGLLMGIVFVALFIGITNALLPYIKLNGEYLNPGSLEEGTIVYKYLVSGEPVELVNSLLQKIGVSIK